MRTCFISLAILCSFAGSVSQAFAECTSDVDRVELALPKADPRIKADVEALLAKAVAAVEDDDAEACEQAANEALRLLGLPYLSAPPQAAVSE